MKLVCDSSILIDVGKLNLFKNFFLLPYEYLTPDILFANELIDIPNYTKDALYRGGLIVKDMDKEGVLTAIDILNKFTKLSNVDSFAIALAKKCHATLLTGDALMRRVAIDHGIEVYGLLWLTDKMLEEKTLTKRNYKEKLLIMLKDNSFRLPRGEIKKRLERLP